MGLKTSGVISISTTFSHASVQGEASGNSFSLSVVLPLPKVVPEAFNLRASQNRSENVPWDRFLTGGKGGKLTCCASLAIGGACTSAQIYLTRVRDGVGCDLAGTASAGRQL